MWGVLDDKITFLGCRMSQIIFLNGCGSSGKTSIARSIQYLSNELWLTFGVDTFIGMTPFPCEGQQETGYFSFVPGSNDRGPTMRVEPGPRNKQLFGIMPQIAEMLANEENNLIIDEVLFDDLSLKSYAKRLSNHTVYYVGVFCDLELMQEREILRRDRCIGLSSDQIDRVHQGNRSAYDFRVDTSHCSPFETARQILDFVYRNPEPQRFKMIKNQR
jgi:chloramphenicol 3-O phosphotransferase